MNINFCHSCFKLSSCETSRGCLHSFGIYLSGHVLVSFCLVIMDDRSRLESHLKVSISSRHCRKSGGFFAGNLGWCSCSRNTQAKLWLSRISRSWVVFFGAKNLPGWLVEPIYLGIQATYYFCWSPGKIWLMNPKTWLNQRLQVAGRGSFYLLRNRVTCLCLWGEKSEINRIVQAIQGEFVHSSRVWPPSNQCNSEIGHILFPGSSRVALSYTLKSDPHLFKVICFLSFYFNFMEQR